MLKQLKLQTELKQRNLELTGYKTRKAEFEQKQADLTVALSEATTDEDINLVNGQIEELEASVSEADIETKISTVEAEIERISNELNDIEERSKENKTITTTTTNKKEERGDNSMNKFQIRELIKTGEYYERAEVKEFYEKFKNLRAVGGEGLTIPNTVINRIMDIMGDFTTLYPLVNKIKVTGEARILIDTDTTAATWIEQKGTLATGDVGTVTDISFDGYKIGKVTFVDNCMLQDSLINLDDYVTKKIARAIAKGLDLAILKGTGSTGKQPEGIIPQLAGTNKVTVTDPTGYADIVKPIALIDSGDDSVGEIVAVTKRSTYYNRLLGYSVQTASTGEVVAKLPNLNNPDLLGLRVIFNNNMDDDKILYGEFDKYTLVERENITIDKSEHVKFSEDQMAFRGKGRFDGKPTNIDSFVLVTLAYTPATPVTPEG